LIASYTPAAPLSRPPLAANHQKHSRGRIASNPPVLDTDHLAARVPARR
jgi:hypothetical protein